MGLTFGFARTVPHVPGIPTGVTVQLLLVGGGLGSLFALEPRVQLVLKALGTVHLFWLAGRLWRTEAVSEAAAARPISFWQALVVQFVNPRAWLIALTAVSASLETGSRSVLQILPICLVFALVGTPCMAVWAAMGATLRRGLSEPRTIRRVNRLLAALAAATGLMFRA